MKESTKRTDKERKYEKRQMLKKKTNETAKININQTNSWLQNTYDRIVENKLSASVSCLCGWFCLAGWLAFVIIK